MTVTIQILQQFLFNDFIGNYKPSTSEGLTDENYHRET